MGRKKKNALSDEEYEKVKQRALEPFVPTRTMEDVLKHEEEIREESFAVSHRMKDEIKEEARKNILSRAEFEKSLSPWNTM